MWTEAIRDFEAKENHDLTFSLTESLWLFAVLKTDSVGVSTEGRNTNQEAFSVLQMEDDSGLDQSGYIMEKDKIYLFTDWNT